MKTTLEDIEKRHNKNIGYMKLLNYYGYIQHQFLKYSRNIQNAEDYTQDFFMMQWRYKDTINDNISLSYIKKATNQFYWNIRDKSTRAKRQGMLISFEDLNEELEYLPVQMEHIYTKELCNAINNLQSSALKKAIYFFLDYGSFPKDKEKYRQIVKQYRNVLDDYK